MVAVKFSKTKRNSAASAESWATLSSMHFQSLLGEDKTNDFKQHSMGNQVATTLFSKGPNVNSVFIPLFSFNVKNK